MMAKLVIAGRMTDLNEYTKSTRSNKYSGATIKREETERVAWECKVQKIPKFTKKVNCWYTFYMNDYRMDEDNLLIYIKWINDGLMAAGCVKSDGRNYLHIAGVSFPEGRGISRTVVEIKEAE